MELLLIVRRYGTSDSNVQQHSALTTLRAFKQSTSPPFRGHGLQGRQRSDADHTHILLL